LTDPPFDGRGARFLLRCELDAAFFTSTFPQAPAAMSLQSARRQKTSQHSKGGFPRPRDVRVLHDRIHFRSSVRQDERGMPANYRTKRVILRTPTMRCKRPLGPVKAVPVPASIRPPAEPRGAAFKLSSRNLRLQAFSARQAC